MLSDKPAPARQTSGSETATQISSVDYMREHGAGLTAMPSPSQIEDVKKRVEEKEGILPAQQRLIYSGKQM